MKNMQKKKSNSLNLLIRKGNKYLLAFFVANNAIYLNNKQTANFLLFLGENDGTNFTIDYSTKDKLMRKWTLMSFRLDKF